MTELEPAELLPLYALGALDADEVARVEEALAADPSLRVALDGWRETVGALALAAPGVAPCEDERLRLLSALDACSRPGRFEAYASRLANIYDVTVEKARMFLGWIDDPARWQSSPFPGVDLIHLPPGPAAAGADCGLVRMPGGYHFPRHGHHGEEVTFVLQGGCRDSTGTTLEPGREMVLPASAEHDFVTDQGDAYIFAVRFHGIFGIELEKKE